MLGRNARSSSSDPLECSSPPGICFEWDLARARAKAPTQGLLEGGSVSVIIFKFAKPENVPRFCVEATVDEVRKESPDWVVVLAGFGFLVAVGLSTMLSSTLLAKVELLEFDLHFFSILLTHEGSHREVYRDFQPSLTSSAGVAKG